MVNEKPICTSTKKRITNLDGVARFMCPNCGKYEIIRSGQARKTAARYTCPGCGFTGPN